MRAFEVCGLRAAAVAMFLWICGTTGPLAAAPVNASVPAAQDADEAADEDDAAPPVAEPAVDAVPTPDAAGQKPNPGAKPAGDSEDLNNLNDLDDLMQDSGGDAGGVEGWEEEKKPREYPYFEHHGYFRFRADLFWRAHLGNHSRWGGDETQFTSGFRPPITENNANNDPVNDCTTNPNCDKQNDPRNPRKVGDKLDENTIAGANIRFRYLPTIHLSPDLRIKAQFDVLDNLVMGSTPDYAGASTRPDVPLVVFSNTQVAPESGRNSWRDSVRVKQLYGEWRSLIGLWRVGRQASDWGLGILANGGQGDDHDFGDYVDRAMWIGRFWKIYTSLAFDWVSTGPTNEDAADFFGQPHDLEDADDAWEIVASIFMRPISEEEQVLRVRNLQARKVSFDWGLYYVFRHQSLDLTTASEDGLNGNWRRFTTGTSNWDGIGLVQRGAQAHIADAWARLEWRPKFGHKLHLETEWVVLYGHIDNVAEEDTASARDLIQYGGVFQADYTWMGLSGGFEFGLASGDETDGFGILDRANLNRTTTDSNGDVTTTPNKRVSNFKFDRDYIVDLLLFREVIGGVTDAVYIKPWISYDLFDSEEDALGARLDIEYAAAMEPQATPGNSRNLGLEIDLRLFYEEKRKFAAYLEWGTLVPFAAFDNLRPADADSNLPGRIKAKWATTLQARVLWKF